MKFADILGKGHVCEQWGQIRCLSHKHVTSISTFWLFDVPSSSVFAVVPTVDTTRASWILDQMVRIKRPLLLVGESGTSKTATIHNFLKKLDADTRVSSPSNHACIRFIPSSSIGMSSPLSLDYSDDQLLVQNNFSGPAEKLGGQCGEKDQRDLRASSGEETAGLHGWPEYAKGTFSSPQPVLLLYCHEWQHWYVRHCSYTLI